MAGRKCPKCGRLTFHVIGKRGECSNCGLQIVEPTGSGKGAKCPFCHENTFRNGKCSNCGAK